MTDEATPPEESGAEEEMEFDMLELLDDYVSSAMDNVKGIADGLMVLEKNPEDQETLFDVLRRAHGMKGSSNMIGFTDIGEITHKMEDFLKNFHDNKLALPADAVDLILSAMDTVTMLIEKKKEDHEFTVDVAPVVATFEGYDFERAKKGGPSAPAPAQAPAAEAAPHKSAKELADSIRIRIEKADELILLAGNLLSAKVSISDELGSLAKITRSKKFTRERLIDLFRDLTSASDLMGRAVDEMRSAIMGIRLVPVSNLFNAFPRLVRDLSRRLGKKVEFLTEGGETLLDRQIIEEMNEPLIHMIRNSLDHGLETPAEREAAGKNDTGTIRLSARNEQGKIIITLEDNGRGIDPERVKRKALEKGVITPHEAETMKKLDAQMLIFKPGFSTQEAATDISGRGVGMDAVKNAVERLQGAVEIDSDPGRGSRFNIVLPLTMASTRLLVLSAEGRYIGVPSAYISSAAIITPDMIGGQEGALTFENRGKALPLYYLNTALSGRPPERARNGRRLYVIVVNTGLREAALVVEDILAQREAVVKNMPKNLAGADFWVGAAQSTTGMLIPVLNIHSVMRQCMA